MADFQEWLDAAGGGGAGGDFDGQVDLFGGGGDGADGGPQGAASNRDAVLFCIDCHSTSFVVPPGSPPGTPPPFRSFVQHALRFYQDKIVTSDRDLVGVVLFGTQHQCNAHGFPNLYVFHELDVNSAARVQELEILAQAAAAGGVAADFADKIGHADAVRGPDGTVTKRPRAALSELFWAILHAFNHLGGRKVAFRRAFLFTCEDDPTKGNAVERAKCMARARDLREHGIFVDVYGHGTDFAPRVTLTSNIATPFSQQGHTPIGSANVHVGNSRQTSAARSASPQPYGSGSGNHPTAYQPPIMTSGGGAAPQLSPSPASAGGAAAGLQQPPRAQPRADGGGATVTAGTGLPGFDRRVFWDQLLGIATDGGSPLLYPDPAPSPARGSSLGSVHVGDLGKPDFGGALSEHRMRTYAQRPVTSLSLSVGPGTDAPSVGVQVFLPVAPCPKPKLLWLEAATNALVTSEQSMVSRETGAVVTAAELAHTAPVASGDRVTFAADEVAAIKKQFGSPGIRILGFRKESHLRSKWSIGKSSFLAPHEATCGHTGLVFFKELHRNLSSTQRFAVAEVLAREGAQPRLVALIAATPKNTCPAAVEPGSCGFHLFPLPYADDYRSITLPPGTVGIEPPAAAVTTASNIVRKLTVEFDATAVPNPSLQQQYHLLQQLALMDDDRTPPEDLSLPDREGMKTFAPLFREFMGAWGEQATGYSPDFYAPQPKAAKPPPSAADMAAIDMDSLEQNGQLATLTVPFLKKYLQDHHQPTGGLKKDLVERATAFIKARREKRDREE